MSIRKNWEQWVNNKKLDAQDYRDMEEELEEEIEEEERQSRKRVSQKKSKAKTKRTKDDDQ